MGKTSGESFDFEKVYQAFPKRMGKKIGIERCKRSITTQEEYEDLMRAVVNYSNYCATEGLEPRFIKHFSSFMSIWQDWLDEDAGTLNLQFKDLQNNQTLKILRNK
jgi:hypothetical protein